MVSDFRRKKLLRGFRFLDTDKSGSIEKADFDMALDKIKEARGWTDDEPKFVAAKDFMMKYWEGIQAQADTDNDGQVTEGEWLKVWDEYAFSSTPREWQANFEKAVFESFDSDKDGTFDVEDFVKAIASTNKTREIIVTAFEKIANGETSINFERFSELWKEYFTSEDPDAPGNFIWADFD